MVPGGGIEPPTRGFSIQVYPCDFKYLRQNNCQTLPDQIKDLREFVKPGWSTW